jgi:hypothetical protein
VLEKHSRLTDDGRAFWWTERLWRLASDLPVQRVQIVDIADFGIAGSETGPLPVVRSQSMLG